VSQSAFEMTSSDVLSSIQLSNAVGWGRPEIYAATFLAPDALTLELSFDTPIADVATSLFFYGVHPKHILDDIDITAEYDVIANHPANTGADLSLVIGTGPFRVTEYVPGDHETLSRFDGYWAGRPNLAGIIHRVFGSVDQYGTGLTSGDIDLAGQTTLDSILPA
jgi:peptide/nickel transport system substrate-binding protein